MNLHKKVLGLDYLSNQIRNSISILTRESAFCFLKDVRPIYRVIYFVVLLNEKKISVNKFIFIFSYKNVTKVRNVGNNEFPCVSLTCDKLSNELVLPALMSYSI